MRLEIIVTQHSEWFACCAWLILILLDIRLKKFVNWWREREQKTLHRNVGRPTQTTFQPTQFRFNFDKLTESYTHELIALGFHCYILNNVVVLVLILQLLILRLCDAFSNRIQRLWSNSCIFYFILFYFILDAIFILKCLYSIHVFL